MFDGVLPGYSSASVCELLRSAEKNRSTVRRAKVKENAQTKIPVCPDNPVSPVPPPLAASVMPTPITSESEPAVVPQKPRFTFLIHSFSNNQCSPDECSEIPASAWVPRNIGRKALMALPHSVAATMVAEPTSRTSAMMLTPDSLARAFMSPITNLQNSSQTWMTMLTTSEAEKTKQLTTVLSKNIFIT